MTINDLLRERLISKLGLDPDSVGSINDLLYAYLLDPPDNGGGGGGGLDPEDLDTEVAALIQQNSGDPSSIRAALDSLYGTGEGGLNDAGVAALLEDTGSATYAALGLLLADKSGVSADENNALSEGSDGKPFLDADSLKYVAPIWVLEAEETEADIPADFPTEPLFTGGPPPIVLRKKA